MRAVQAASLDDLLALAWLPEAVGRAVYEHLHARRGIEGRMSANGDPWERHATWWRETFTNGADLEYELQILPLATSHLAGRAGARPRKRRGPPRAVASPRAGTREIVVGLDPSGTARRRRRSRDAEAGGGRPAPSQQVRARGGGAPAVPRRHVRRGRLLPRDRARRLIPDAVLAEAVRVLAPGGRFLLLVNHPMFQGTGSGFVDDQILGEHYWRVGPVPHEDVVFEEVDPGVRLRFAHRPLVALRQPA